MTLYLNYTNNITININGELNDYLFDDSIVCALNINFFMIKCMLNICENVKYICLIIFVIWK